MSEQPEIAPDPQPGETTPAGEADDPRPSRRNAWLAMGAVLLALVLLMFVPDPGEQEAPPPPADGAAADADPDGDGALVGRPARLDFTLKDMNGIDVKLESFRGKVILLNFWATWCGPCKAEIPDLVSLQAQYRDDLVVLGVSVDDTPDKMKPYAAEYKINYPLLVGNGRDDVQDAFGPLWGIPVSVIIDRDGRVAKKHSGIGSREQFEREIVPLFGA
jgi:thiol-disulfide isomerase/thioredoxin